jgi:hypothetical protein
VNHDTDTAADEIPRLRQAFASLSHDAVPTPECPPAEQLWDAARGARAGNVRELVEHMATCGACAEAWRLARELEPAAGAREPRSTAQPWWRQQRWIAVAAAAAMALVLGMTWRPPADAPAEVVRGAIQERVARTPEDGGRLSLEDPVLAWQATDGATYDLTVMTAELDRTLVRIDGLEAAEYRIPDDALRGVAAGSELLWFVAVWTPDGGSVLPTYKLVVE